MIEETTVSLDSCELGGPPEGIAPRPASQGQLILTGKMSPEAFAEFYDAHYEKILNYIYRRTLDVSVAEELTSNTFFKALASLAGFRGGSPRAWLYKIATNELRMAWRSKKTRSDNQTVRQEDLRRLYFDAHQSAQPADIAEKAQQFQQLRHALARLPEKYQTVLMLRYFEDLKIQEISAVLSKKTGTVKSLIHRGLKRLKKLISAGDATFSSDVHLNDSVGDDNDER